MNSNNGQFTIYTDLVEFTVEEYFTESNDQEDSKEKKDNLEKDNEDNERKENN